MRTLLLLISFFLVACNNAENESSKNNNGSKADSITGKMGGLSKISWINGNWKGLYEGKPFYESYQIINDSLMEITSYEFNGSDTSKSLLSRVYWKDGYYYLGDSLNWKVTSLTDHQIHMEPNYKAGNDITWSFQDSATWTAVLRSAAATSTYIMQRQPSIDSLLKTKRR